MYTAKEKEMHRYGKQTVVEIKTHTDSVAGYTPRKKELVRPCVAWTQGVITDGQCKIKIRASENWFMLASTWKEFQKGKEGGTGKCFNIWNILGPKGRFQIAALERPLCSEEDRLCVCVCVRVRARARACMFTCGWVCVTTSQDIRLSWGQGSREK